MQESGARRPLVQFLSSLGDELQSAAEAVEDLHVLVEATIKDGAKSELVYREAQTVDILQQHLIALARFVGHISRVTPETWVVESQEALDQVKLSGLRARLERLHEFHRPGSGGSGELEIF